MVDARVYKHLAALRLDSGVDDRDLKRHDFFEVAIDSAGVDSVQSLAILKIDPAQEFGKTRIAAQDVHRRLDFQSRDAGVSNISCFLQPKKRGVFVLEPHVNFGHGIRIVVITLLGVLHKFEGLLPQSLTAGRLISRGQRGFDPVLLFRRKRMKKTFDDMRNRLTVHSAFEVRRIQKDMGDEVVWVPVSFDKPLNLAKYCAVADALKQNTEASEKNNQKCGQFSGKP